MNDIWKQWIEDNFKYIAMAVQSTEEDREQVSKLARVCEKYGVSFKTYCDILSEFGKED